MGQGINRRDLLRAGAAAGLAAATPRAPRGQAPAVHVRTGFQPTVASSPAPSPAWENQILFGADDGAYGRGLWAIPVSDLAPLKRSCRCAHLDSDVHRVVHVHPESR